MSSQNYSFTYDGKSAVLQESRNSFLTVRVNRRSSTSSHHAFSFDVFAEEDVLSVVDGVGELANPVTENHHAGAFGELEVEFDVAVAVEKEVDVGVAADVLFGVEHEVLAVLAHVCGFFHTGVFETAVARPGQPELHGPTRVDGRKETLAEAVVEDGAYEAELPVGVTQSVAVGEEESAAVDFGGQGLAVDDDAAFLFEIAVGPDVVVAGEEVDFDTHIGQFGEFSEETGVAAGHDITVFVPEVKHVAKEIDSGGLVLDAVEETDQTALVHARMVYGERAQMGVGKEIYRLHNS